MKVLTFNVNGLRSLKEYYLSTRKWSFDQLLDSFDADIICFQETKINKPDQVDHDLAFPKGYHAYFAFPRVPRKTGYSGVVTYVRNSCKHPARSFLDGLARPEVLNSPNCSLGRYYPSETLELLDSEARVVMTDHGAFLLFNVYFPNDGGSERAEFRERFYSAINIRCRDLVKAGKSVIIACDLNTTYSFIDHCDYVKPYIELAQEQTPSKLAGQFDSFAKSLYKEHLEDDGSLIMEELHEIPERFDIANLDREYPALIQEFLMTKPSRIWAYYMFSVLDGPFKFIDCFRVHHPDEPNKFTCWNTLISARGSNYGTRIDYIIAMGPLFSDCDLKKVVTDADQMYSFMGSDHCPVWTRFDIEPAPWTTDVKPAVEQHQTKLHQQKRLDQFFKPKLKAIEQTQDLKRNDDSLSPSDIEPLPKKVKTLSDAKLPFAKPKTEAAPPLCKSHGEPGRLFTVNKPGPNKGKKFYACSRPVGHPTDPEARCNFFQWQE